MAWLIINSVIRAVFAYILLLVLARIVGRKAISRMTFFDFAIGIMMGTIAANYAVLLRESSVSLATALITVCILAVIVGYLSTKSFTIRKIVNSEPVVVIDKGRVIEDNLKRVRLTMNGLSSLLREKNTFSIADVEFAVMENDGKLSVLKKSGKEPLTPSDLNMNTQYKGLTRDIIMDGKILDENLKYSNLNEEMVLNSLRCQGIEDAGEVFYAGLDSSGNLYISLKSKKTEGHGKYGIE